MTYNLERINATQHGRHLVKCPPGYPGKWYGGLYTYEYRAVWWLHYGELPPKGWHIHHINGDHSDNRIENLEAIPASEHVKKEGHIADMPPAEEEELTCFHCQKRFTTQKYNLTYRRNQGQDKFFCTKSCQTTYQNQFKKGKKNNYPKERHNANPEPVVTLSCHACAKAFTISVRNLKSRIKQGVKKFSCSRSCVNKRSLTHDYGVGICETCNEPFQKQTPKHNLYCGSYCRSHAHYIKSKLPTE